MGNGGANIVKIINQLMKLLHRLHGLLICNRRMVIRLYICTFAHLHIFKSAHLQIYKFAHYSYLCQVF
jgi:hypothetical protein